ncbi:MAG: hypothetical protein ABIV06_04820 [Thermoanaerobaculia bacterium]
MQGVRIGTWFVGACLLAIPASSGGWDAIPPGPDQEETQAAPEGGFVSPWNLGYSDFVPQSGGSDDCHYDTPSQGNGGFVAADSPGGVCCLVAGVRLPDGATVTALILYLRDNSADDVTISLRRKRIDDESTSTAMASATTSGTGTGVRIFSDVSISEAVVDNRNYTYFVSTDTCLDQELDLRLLGGLLFFSEAS